MMERKSQVLTLEGRIILSLFRSRNPTDYPQIVGFDTYFVDADSEHPLWPQRWGQGELTALAASVFPRGPVAVAVLRHTPNHLSLQALSPASTDQHQVVGEGLHHIQEATVRALSVGEVDDRVVVAFAPDYEGSGFVKLMEVEPNVEGSWENYEIPPTDPGAVYLSNLDIWSVVPGDAPGVRVLASRPQVCFLNVRSGSSWGFPANLEPTPEAVSHALAITPKPVKPVFSTLNADKATPIGLDEVQAATEHLSSSFESLRLRKGDPGSWPATTVSRGTLDGRAVLVCGSYQGAIWIWDLDRKSILAGPFADVPDEFEFNPHTKMAASAISVTTDVAIGDVDGEDVVVAAVAGKVKLYDAKTGATLPEPAVSTSIVVAVALGSFDGRSILVTGSRGGVLAVWEVKTAKRLTGVTLDSEINGVWMVNGADAIAARNKEGQLFVFDLVQNGTA